MNITKIIVIRSSDNADVLEMSRNVREVLEQRGYKVTEFLEHYTQVNDTRLSEGDFDLAIVVGGDGTTLRASRMCATGDIPILPVNKGRFGFINEILQDEWQDAFDDLLYDRCNIGEYHLLEVQIGTESWFAFNDVTFASAGYGAMAASIYRDNKLVTRYWADGVIVSTPTGSTAHSLSAGGPIIAPGINAFMINPIAPFSLSNRPIILPIEKELVVVQEESRSQGMLVLDGYVALGLLKGCEITIRDSRLKSKIVHSSKRDYFEILRDKLGWAGEFRA